MELRGCLPTATARARCCGDAGWRRQKERCRECLCIAKLPVNCYERSLFTEKGAHWRASNPIIRLSFLQRTSQKKAPRARAQQPPHLHFAAVARHHAPQYA